MIFYLLRLPALTHVLHAQAAFLVLVPSARIFGSVGLRIFATSRESCPSISLYIFLQSDYSSPNPHLIQQIVESSIFLTSA